MSRYRYAARLNSFAALRERFWPGRTTPLSTLDLIDRAATVPGLTAVDVNFPQQTEGIPVAELRARIEGHGLHLNGYAMRYGGDPAFRSGAFTNADPAIRRRAIDLTKRAVDETRAAGGRMLTIWPGQDGFDHPFQVDYAQLWDWEVEGIRAVAEHDPSFPVSIEYKPNEPRSVFILPNVHATLLAIAEAGAKNLGVTLDVAHVFEADTNPALAAALVGRRSRLLGLHINDAYGRRDDGLMVGAVHTVQTIELLRRMRLDGFDGTIYLDTFPDTAALDPVDEARTGIAVIEAMLDLLDRLPEAELQAALTRHDAIAAHRIVQSAILGRAI